MPPFNPSPANAPSVPESNEVNYENFDKLKEVTGGRIDISSFLKGISSLSENENKYLDTLTDTSKASQEFNLLESEAKERDALHLAKMLTGQDDWYAENGYLEQEQVAIDKCLDYLMEYFAALPRESRDGNFAMRTLLESITSIYLDSVPSKPIGYGENPGEGKLKRLVSALYPDGIKNPRGGTEKRLEEFRRNYFVMGREDKEKVEEAIRVFNGLNELQKRYLLKQVSSSLGNSEVDFIEEH